MRQDSNKKKLKTIQVIVILLAFITILGCIIYFGWPFFTVINNPEQARKMIIDAGAWGPFVFILMQIAQILIAPVPGQVVGLIGGYLFGPLLGLIYTLIGATIGFTIIFFLTKKLGRPFVERFVNKKVLDKFDHLIEEKGVMVFFLIFLLPAFPDDIISFIAGLTTIRIRTLVLISLAGRLPGYLILSLMGNGLSYENLSPVVVAFIVFALMFVIARWKRAWLREFVEHNNRILFIKEKWSASRTTVFLWTIGILIVAVLLYRLVTVAPIQQ